MQLPLSSPLCIREYLQLLKRPTLKYWPMPCPLCDAERCAKFLCCYTRRYVYCLGMVYENVEIVRFICSRMNPQVVAGTHRTFSLLPVFLIPYCRYALDLTMAIAEELTRHAENVYQTTDLLINRFEQPAQASAVNVNATTIARVKTRLLSVINKLNRLPLKHQQAIGWPKRAKRLSDLLGFVQNYQARLRTDWGCAYGLSHDWFYHFHQDQPYMVRDWLFGTASQRRL